MSQILISIFGFLLAICILVTVHEYGHFWVARRCGIKVLRFSIGFGRPFLRWYDKLGTEYVISMIPLGGYVALYGERGTDIPESQRHLAFAYKPLTARMMVLAAGPLANLLFAVFAYWLMFIVGITSLAPVIGGVTQGSVAELAGLKPRDEIISFEHKPTHSWEAVSIALVSALGSEKTISLDTKRLGEATVANHTLDLSSLEHQTQQHDLLKELGIIPLDPYPPVIGKVISGYPAENSGLQAGDRIVAVNDHPVFSRGEVTEIVQPSIDNTLVLSVNRHNNLLKLNVQPVAKRLDDGQVIGFIGIEYDQQVAIAPDLMRQQHYGPWVALKQATKRTYHYTLLTMQMLKKMVVGSISVNNLSGPIAIAQYAGQSVSFGIEYFLSFLAVISISLGVLNLLPIPLLDGGHLMYCIYELITGKRVSEHAQSVGMVIGGIILLSVMLLSFYNDIARL